MSISKQAESLLLEIIEHRKENGQCDLDYWKRRFERLSSATSQAFHLRAIFNELSQAGLINVNWGSDGIYIMRIFPKGFEYFDDVSDNVVTNTVYRNNILYDEGVGPRILQGNTNVAQINSINMADSYRNLMTKDIYAILDGDESYGEYESREGKKVRIALPYLSGPVLCDISTKFGKAVDYSRSGGPSRWSYVDGLLDHCIKNGTCSTLLRFLFSRSQFQDVFKGLDIDEIEDAYKKSVDAAIEGINRNLLFSGTQLVYRDKKFTVIPADKKVLSDDEILDSVFWEEKKDPFSSLNEYEQCERLGQGGFGEVYRYHNNNLDMDFAVKIYNPWFVSDDEREEGEKRFFREAKMLFTLNHQNIVRIYDAGRINGNPFIRMELVNGDNLDKFREKSGNLSPLDALKATRQILKGLSFAHDAGVIHRDLKPSNVVVSEYGKKLRCVIIDFGIGAFMETEGYTRLTRTGEHIAGGQYIDPRLIDNPKLRDCRTDIYSVGAILYFLLCGRAPVGSDIESYLKQTNTDVDERVLGILRRSLSSELENRFDSCVQFIQAINEIVGE